MVRQFAVSRAAGMLLTALFALNVCALEPVVTPKPEPGKTPAAEKPKGPEHNVTLMEEPGVMDLFNKAAKARARAEKEPEAWPECVKCYADILKKYPNTVYLDKWEGADKDHPLTAYKNGLYKSTRERVANEIAALPPAALTVYRVINESAARALYFEGQEQFDERKMEQVARNYFQTPWSNDALAWLGEASYERGAMRDAAERLRKAAANPGSTATPMSVLARLFLAQVRLADKAGAAKTLASIEEALHDPAKGALRIGASEGPAALAKLKARLEGIAAANSVAENVDSNGDWTTYYGNAAHTQMGQSRDARGLRKWSVRIAELLYGKSAPAIEGDKVVGDDGSTVQDGSINQQLTVKDGYFYINNGQVYAAYPVGDPGFGTANSGGKAKYQLPAENAKAPPVVATKPKINPINGNVTQQTSVVQHPYFTTLAGDRAYGILGTESFAQGVNFNGARFFRGRMGGTDENAKGVSNYPICIGRSKDGREPAVVWSLKPGEPAFLSQSKAEQEWLKTAYFVSSPTFESGVLYSMAVVMPPNSDGASVPLDAWAVAIDADNGQVLWHTQICTATPIRYGMGGAGDVQPDRGLPVAVANRTVYVVTNLGAVAALDAGGGAVKWIRIYDRTKTAADQMFNAGEVATTHDFWAPNPPIVYKNRLIASPQDSETLYGYDIETGARAWEKSRLGDQDASALSVNGSAVAPPGSFKHVLGIANGALVLTGKDILFINALNGKNLADIVTIDGTIKGRGAVTEKAAWISTDKDLLRIDIANDNGKFKFSEAKAFKWADPKIEAGSVYSADGAMYTVSHTHVNAYVVWEELEAKLLERLKTEPENVSVRVELADIYRSIEHYLPALTELDKARAIATKSGVDGKADEMLASIATRKFETYMGLGDQTRREGKPAIEFYQSAYQAALEKGVAEILPVMALKAQAEIFEAEGKLPEAVRAYQDMIVKHGNAVLVDRPQSSKMVRLYAQTRQSELKAKDPACFAAIDAEAKAAFTGAGSDLQKLEQLIAQYPISEFAGKAQLAIARMELEKAPDGARRNAMRFLSRQRAGEGSAEALAILAVACERLDLLPSAHDALTQLATNPDYKNAKASLQGIWPKAAAGDASLSEWAAKRLEEPLYQRAPSQAVFAMGSEKVSDKALWTKTNIEGTIPLVPDGIPPVEMRRAVFSIEPHNEISAIGGRDGLDLWKPRPSAPLNSHGRSFWWERLLIVCGESSIVAYDSTENGKVSWTQELKIERPNEIGYWAQINGDRLVIAHSGNTLRGFDAASGRALWETKLPASQLNFPPVCGDGFVAVVSANSNQLNAYNLETGGVNWSVDVAELRSPPVVSGDRVYVIQRTHILSVFDGKTGKHACPDITFDVPAISMRAAGDLAIVSLENRSLAAYRCDSKNPGKVWQTLLPSGSVVTEFSVDGDDLLVTSMLSQSQYELSAFSIKSQGKIKWKQGMAADAAAQLGQIQRGNGVRINNLGGRVNVIGGGRVIINGQIVVTGNNGDDDGAANFAYGSDGSGGWVRENIARDSLIVMQSSWDITGAVSKVAALIDRATGKSIWDVHLRCEQMPDGSIPLPRIQFFDGGLVVSEPHGRAGFSAPLARDKVEREKGLNELMAMLSDAKNTDANFADAYAQFAALRKESALKQHASLVFQRVDKAPDVAGGAAGWESIAETAFNGWKDVYLASEDAASRIQATKELWRGADDLKAAFKGAYDDTNLYVQIAVKDDLHKNEQTGSNIDFGDSVRFAFDIDLAGGLGYRGKSFELALGLGKGGQAQGWRRVENHLFLRGLNPIEKGYSVTRNEADKTTLYQIALPLEYLGLKPEAGKKFGFTFAVQDQDVGTGIDKSICPSPGLMGAREPRLFSQGVLEAKK